MLRVINTALNMKIHQENRQIKEGFFETAASAHLKDDTHRGITLNQALEAKGISDNSHPSPRTLRTPYINLDADALNSELTTQSFQPKDSLINMSPLLPIQDACMPGSMTPLPPLLLNMLIMIRTD